MAARRYEIRVACHKNVVAEPPWLFGTLGHEPHVCEFGRKVAERLVQGAGPTSGQWRANIGKLDTPFAQMLVDGPST